MFPPDSGVVISGSIPILQQDSWVEAPVVIQATLVPNNLVQIGAFTGVYGGKLGHCRIGRYCSIAPGVDISSDQHPNDWLSTSMLQYVNNVHGWGEWLVKNGYEYNKPVKKFISNAPVTIGNDVWIGQGVFIKSGVTIGDGAIIAAHSVVTRDVEPYAIVAGVPAKTLRSRFDDELVKRFLEIKWWNYNIMSLPQIDFSSPISALKEIENAIAREIVQPLSGVRFSFAY